MQIWPHKHIHSLANFSIKDYESVFELANRFDALKNAGTKNSFELAAKRLNQTKHYLANLAHFIFTNLMAFIIV